MNACKAIRCTACCEHTNMLLTPHDLTRIEELGYTAASFTKPGPLGMQLKNTNGHCVFLKAGHCTIYEHRPTGCTLYPVVFDKDSGQAIVDDNCPRYHDFPLTQETRQRLHHLIQTLFSDGL